MKICLYVPLAKGKGNILFDTEEHIYATNVTIRPEYVWVVVKSEEEIKFMIKRLKSMGYEKVLPEIIQYTNRVVFHVEEDDKHILILKATGNADYWYWIFNKCDFYKNTEPDIGNLTVFANDPDNETVGFSGAGFNSIRDAFDAALSHKGINSQVRSGEGDIKRVNIKRLTKTAKLPTRGSNQAAGYDLYGDNEEAIAIEPHATVKVGTGLAMELPNGYFGAVFARSGLAAKKGLRPANAVGVCDSDYRGEYIVALHNDTDEVQTIDPHERIAQLVVMPYLPVMFNEVEELSDTERGEGGFGSTGTK